MDFFKQYDKPDNPDGCFEKYFGPQGICCVDIMMDLSLIGEQISTPRQLQTSNAVFTTPPRGRPRISMKFKNNARLPLQRQNFHLAFLFPGQISEIAGPSGVGKTQLVWQMIAHALEADEENDAAVLINTESELQSLRLLQMMRAELSLNKLYYTYSADIENLDHVLETQLPALLLKLRRQNARPKAVIIDSIAHHLRARKSFVSNCSSIRKHIDSKLLYLSKLPGFGEFWTRQTGVLFQFFRGNSEYLSRRAQKYYFLETYRQIRKIALKFEVAIIMTNQVSDMFTRQRSEHGHSSCSLDLLWQMKKYAGWDAQTIFDDQHTSDLIGSFEGYDKGESAKRSKRRRLDYSSKQKSEEADLKNETLAVIAERKVPALGYQWSKLITQRVIVSRILLNDHDSKGYRELRGFKVLGSHIKRIGNCNSGGSFFKIDSSGVSLLARDHLGKDHVSGCDKQLNHHESTS